LVNGVTVTQGEAVERLEYFHIELNTHDVFIAESCVTETYLDHGNRAMFHNAGEHDALSAHATPMRRAQYAPRVASRVDALASLARLAARAGLSTPPEATDEEFTPMLPNPLMAGAATGPNGSLPTGWSAYCGAALAFAVTETGEEDGGAFIDIRLSGMSDCHTMAHQLLFAAPDGIAARHGERWRVAVRARVRAGSLDDATRIEIGANLNAARGVYSSWFGSSAVLPDTDCAVAPRLLRIAAIADRHARFLQPVIQVGTIAGRPIDVTLRISLPSAGPLQRPRLLRTA